jgi:hypothetical protein
MTDEEILATYKPTKSKRRCAFCTSCACYERVVTKDMIFDEVACNRHQPALYRLSDIHLPGVGKMFISSTGYMERGESVDFEEFKKEIKELTQ